MDITEEEPFKTYCKAGQSIYDSKHDGASATGRGEGNEGWCSASGELVH